MLTFFVVVSLLFPPYSVFSLEPVKSLPLSVLSFNFDLHDTNFNLSLRVYLLPILLDYRWFERLQQYHDSLLPYAFSGCAKESGADKRLGFLYWDAGLMHIRIDTPSLLVPDCSRKRARASVVERYDHHVA